MLHGLNRTVVKAQLNLVICLKATAPGYVLLKWRDAHHRMVSVRHAHVS
jgi:hypothetical protein